MSKCHRIIACAGGGMKGLPQAAALMELRRLAGGNLSKCVDLFAGTSIGAINSALASYDVPGDWTEFFTEHGPVIFRRSLWRHWPRYSAEGIEAALQRAFDGLTMSGCKSRLLVTALDRTNQQPFMFKTYDTRNLVLGGATPVWQACRASSSAQRYFPAFRYGGRFMWDGGNIANNPSACAFFERKKLGLDKGTLKILSLGCGDEKMPVVRWPQWVQDLMLTIGLQFDTSQDEVDYQMEQELGLNYRDLHPVFTGPVSLDDASPRALAWLKSAANFFVQQNRPVFEWFLSDD